MSDAFLAGRSGNPPEKVKQESIHHQTTTGLSTDKPDSVSSPATDATANSASGTSTVTTSGSIVSSDDPTTKPDASMGEKLKGDFMGAVNGTIGSLQAATGTAIRNKDMESKGLAKMQEEDQRLGAKQGVMPVGSNLREETVDASQAGPNTTT